MLKMDKNKSLIEAYFNKPFYNKLLNINNSIN